MTDSPLDALRAQPGLTGGALRRALVTTADAWLTTLLGDPGPDVALVAVGGYGRAEPAFGSDLDLLILHWRPRPEVALIADRVWYPLWDAGVGLDHSVRTVDDAVEVADGDLKAMLGLLDARHVAGDPALTADLRQRVRALWRQSARRRLPELRAAVDDRARTAGEVAFLLEPDLKEGRGGLRDVHALQALAVTQLVDPPPRPAQEAYSFLLDVRGELHRRGGRRPSDRLLLQEQPMVAEALGLADDDALLRAVSAAARTISYTSDTTWRLVSAQTAPPPRRFPLGRRRVVASPERLPLAADVVEQGSEVVLARDADPGSDAVLVLRVAASAAGAGLPIAPHTLDRLAALAPPMPEPWPAAARDALVATLGAGKAAVPVLEALDQSGLLVRLLPEWESVRARPQRNAYHRFTVDRHLVEAAAEAAALTRRVSRPDLLLLGALLHDIGKGRPGDHTDNGIELVQVIGPRLGLGPDDVAVLVRLVRHHLLLADTAVRRDLDDPATLARVAEAVGDRETLALLHALTEADAAATGPAVWSDWKAGLVSETVRRTARLLDGMPAPVPRGLTEQQQALVSGGVFATATREVAAGVTEVTVVAPDRAGLLSAVAGTLALHRLDVRSADAGAEGATAWTVFGVTPRFGSAPDWDVVRADLRRAVEGGLDVGARLAEREAAYAGSRSTTVAPPAVLWLDDVSDVASVVEVRAHDGVGLLSRISAALGEAGLDVRSARVSTLGAEAVDAFYVTRDGVPVADVAVRAEAVLAVLAALA